MTTPLARAAGAPISWGVCEVPGWGHQLDLDTVLGQMRSLGLTATELGPDGFLPEAPDKRAAVLAAEGLRAVGGFVPLVLHDADHDPEPALHAALDGLVACGADVLVLAAATGVDGYEGRPALDAAGWTHLLSEVDRVAALAARRGVTVALHPHVGTMVETPDDITRVLEHASVDLCLDTGHVLVGGGDPVEVARAGGERVVHAHLKDVDAALAERVRAGELAYQQGVAQGLYRPLGTGDARVADVVRQLEQDGYAGWYVLEQDVVLAGPQDAPAALADVRASLDLLARLS
ncbi:sugar phosphate isomerase/epimerase [Angustibacter peucedani]